MLFDLIMTGIYCYRGWRVSSVFRYGIAADFYVRCRPVRPAGHGRERRFETGGVGPVCRAGGNLCALAAQKASSSRGGAVERDRGSEGNASHAGGLQSAWPSTAPHPLRQFRCYR